MQPPSLKCPNAGEVNHEKTSDAAGGDEPADMHGPVRKHGLGPEGGNRGGEIIAAGTPEKIVKVKASYTGKYLKSVLK